MVEYPNIPNASRAPRKPCYGFEKLDGSNIRVKWTRKRAFTLFGTRTQLFDETDPLFGECCSVFERDCSKPLEQLFRRHLRNEMEIIVYGEFEGPNSFAGSHVPEDPKEFVTFDLLIGRHNRREFLLPQEFVRMVGDVVKTPRVLYVGNLNDQLISDVREGVYGDGEGMLCKGTARDSRGDVWRAKIKTNAYRLRLQERFGQKWSDYWE